MWNLVYTILNLLSCVAPNIENPEVELLFVGDAMQHQAQLDKALELGGDKYDYSDCFTLISPAIKEADYAVCNLEVPLGGGPDYSGYPCFSAPDSYAVALKEAGFDMFLTANNHSLDRRGKAAKRTLKALDSLGIDHIGTYHSIEERDSLVPFIKNIKGFNIAFLNYTYGTNGIRPDDGVEVAIIDKERMKEEINRAREKGAEIVVVAMHWGIEYVLLQTNVQEELANYLIDCGADLIIGGHPHVVQPMKTVHDEKTGKDVLIVYSLGNFISNMNTADTRGGGMVWVTLERDSQGKAKFKKAEYSTLFSAKPVGKRNFRVIPGWMEDSIPGSQKYNWQIFNRGAQKVFDEYNVNVSKRIPL